MLPSSSKSVATTAATLLKVSSCVVLCSFASCGCLLGLPGRGFFENQVRFQNVEIWGVWPVIESSTSASDTWIKRSNFLQRLCHANVAERQRLFRQREIRKCLSLSQVVDSSQAAYPHEKQRDLKKTLKKDFWRPRTKCVCVCLKKGSVGFLFFKRTFYQQKQGWLVSWLQIHLS